MIEKRISLRYARAIFDVAEKENIEEQVVKDFDTVNKFKEESRDLFNLMNSPVVPYWKKVKIYEEIFKDALSEAMLRFIQLLAEKHREKLFDSIHFQFMKIYNQKHNILPVTVTTARDIETSLKDKVISQLSNYTGKKVLAEFEKKPDIKGGIKIQIEDWVYDASLSTRLKLLHEQLIGSSELEIDIQNN